MSRALIILTSSANRERAQKLCREAPTGTRVEFKAARRTLPQNSKMWAMLTDISRQVTWHGSKYKPDDWKTIFLNGLARERRTVPSIDGEGWVSLERSSSNLTKAEMSELIELMFAFGAQHFVQFKEDVSW